MRHNRFSSIPLVNLARQYEAIRAEIQQAVEEAVSRCTYASGPAVEAFEKAFSRYCGVEHCVCVNSGTSALHLALIACGVEPGDEVITVPMTFIATAWAISYVGARPVFVDIEPGTCTMNVAQVEQAVSSSTRAVVPVHLYGQMADLDPLLEICNRHGLALIEDAAQAHGAEYWGRRAGGIGRAGCFSFYPGKNLGAYGEGGAIVTNDDELASRVGSLRDHAQSVKHRHDELGFNYRMDDIQGAVLGVKLRHLEKWNMARRTLAERYGEMLSDTPLAIPSTLEGLRHVWHLYVVRHPDRDRLQRILREAGISTGLHYPIPIHLQPAYEHLGYGAGEFPVAEQVARECLSLPICAELGLDEQHHIIQTLTHALEMTA